MRYSLYLYLACMCIFAYSENNAHSQILAGGEPPILQDARIGLVDEFLKRFNGNTSHPDVSSKDADFRKSNILYLIEPPQKTENRDSLFDAAVKFTDAITKDSISLKFSDTTWVAHATCKGVLEGKKVTLNAYLNVEHRKDDMYKWVISRVDGDCFDTTPKDITNNIMLYPDDHEIKFISLGRMTKEQPFNVSRFMSKEFEYDTTSAFVYLVRSNKLKIEFVEELEFIFTQVPDYIFSIKYFERETGKSGWLINRFETISPEDKRKFLLDLNINVMCSGSCRGHRCR